MQSVSIMIVIIGFLAVTGGGMALIGFYLYRSQLSSQRKALTHVSNHLGGRLLTSDAGDDVLEIVQDGVPVWFGFETTGTHEHSHWHTARVELPHAADWYVLISPSNMLGVAFDALIGVPDLETGDATFDGAFQCKSNDTVRLQQLLAQRNVRAMMVALPEVYVSVEHGVLRVRLYNKGVNVNAHAGQVQLAAILARAMASA